MKKYLFISLLTFITIATKAQNGADQTPYSTKSLTNENIKNVQVETSGGSISVSGVTSDARIEMYVWPNNGNNNSLSKDEIQKRLNEDYDINISVNNNKLVATAKQKDRNMNWKKSLSISFKVFVPQNVSTDLHTSGGSISLTNLSGNQNFTTSGGSLHVDEVSGKITGKTSGGSIHLSNSKNDIDLRTSGGSIEANNCNGNLTLETSGGSLKLTSLQGIIHANTSGGSVNGSDINGELAAHTSGGSVKLTNLSCSLETSTSGGSIDVAITTLGKYVKINNGGGDIDLQLPQGKGMDLQLSARKIKTGTMNNFSGTTEDDNVRGKLNGGGVPVTVDASSGRINLTWN
ncbi:MAG: DUF4097 family beta strand repeat-containing protein [Chitinophagaceae bacterium]